MITTAPTKPVIVLMTKTGGVWEGWEEKLHSVPYLSKVEYDFKVSSCSVWI